MEILRRWARCVFGSNSHLYRYARNAVNFYSVAKKESFSTYKLLRTLGTAVSESPVPINLKSLQFPLFVRPGTIDIHVVIDTVIREEYGKFKLANDPLYAIDAGAYIGDTAAYFLSRWPDLKVIALEPNLNTFKMASLNLRPYGDRSVLLNKGLWSTDGQVSFSGEANAFGIDKMGETIECVGLNTLMDEFAIPCIDILKMDIEGAEESIFLANPQQWLHRVNMLIIEIHSRAAYELISTVLKDNNFSMKQFRSIYYCQRS